MDSFSFEKREWKGEPSAATKERLENWEKVKDSTPLESLLFTPETIGSIRAKFSEGILKAQEKDKAIFDSCRSQLQTVSE